MNHASIGWILVLGQFLCLGLLFGLPPSLPFSFAGKAIFFTGILTGIWAVLAMPPASLSVHPQPKSSGKFTSKGPYRLIRHPMYAAVILVAIPQASDHPTTKNIMAVLTLITILVVKIILEEKLLITRYDGYAEYKKTTKKLIPFIW